MSWAFSDVGSHTGLLVLFELHCAFNNSLCRYQLLLCNKVSLPVHGAQLHDDTALCFTPPPPPWMKPDMPQLLLHFDGATLDLPWEN
jgi:hypothetical protein